MQLANINVYIKKEFEDETLDGFYEENRESLREKPTLDEEGYTVFKYQVPMEFDSFGRRLSPTIIINKYLKINQYNRDIYLEINNQISQPEEIILSEEKTQEFCDKLNNHLQTWYQKETERLKTTKPAGWAAAGQSGFHLGAEIEQFLGEHPEFIPYKESVSVGFKITPNSYEPGCLDGCCIPMEKVTGVKASPAPKWEELTYLANFQPKRRHW